MVFHKKARKSVIHKNEGKMREKLRGKFMGNDDTGRRIGIGFLHEKAHADEGCKMMFWKIFQK